MESRIRNLLVSRIMFGAVRCKIGNEPYYLGAPTAFQVFVANEIYEDSMQMAIESNMLFENDAVQILMDTGIWTQAEQQKLDDYPEKIEKTKLELYEYQSRINDFKLCKKRLEIYRTEMLDLINKRHRLDYITAEGFASFCKINYLMGAGLRDRNFKPLWTDETFFDDRSGILDEIRLEYNKTRIYDGKIRELSRTDPWRLTWNTGNKTNMFGKTALEMTDEQKNLVAWSRLYDSIYESMEPPSDDIINDDDLLDAWMILQRKKREEKKSEQRQEELRVSRNDKINSSQNVFIMMGEDIDPLTGKKIQMISNVEEAKKLDDILSTDQAKAIKKMRFEAIDKQGSLRHHQLPDIRQDILLQRNNLEIQQKKGKLK